MGDGKQRRARWRQQGSEAAAAAAGCRSRATHCNCAQCIDWLDPRRVVQRHTGRSRVDAAARGDRLLPVSDASRRVCRAAAKETRTGREILNRQIDNREQRVDMLYTINFNFRSAVRAFYVLTLNGIKYLRFIDRMIHVMSNTKTLSNSHTERHKDIRHFTLSRLLHLRAGARASVPACVDAEYTITESACNHLLTSNLTSTRSSDSCGLSGLACTTHTSHVKHARVSYNLMQEVHARAPAQAPAGAGALAASAGVGALANAEAGARPKGAGGAKAGARAMRADGCVL